MPGMSKKPMEQRLAEFWARVDKSGDCWLWTGPTFRDGYGATSTLIKTQRAHRVSWELAHGPIPDGMCVCHTCDVRACVNPDHLWLGTNNENMADMVAKGRSCSGDRHPLRRDPSQRRRGAANYMVQHPEASYFNRAKFSHPGAANPGAKLTEAQVAEIRRRYVPRKVGLQQLADEYGVGTSAIHRIVKGTHWRNVAG